MKKWKYRENTQSNNAHGDNAKLKTQSKLITIFKKTHKNKIMKDDLFGFFWFWCALGFLVVVVGGFFIRAVEIPLAGGPSFLGTGTGFLSSGTRLFGISGTLKR